MQRYLIFILFTLLTSVQLEAQQSTAESTIVGKPLQVKAAYHFGFLIAHRSHMSHLPKHYTNGFELIFERVSSGKEDWQQLYNNPTIGVAVLVTGVGNSDLLGNGIGINPYISLPLYQSDHFRLHTSWGYGLGYLTKKFDPDDNHRNNAVGSNLNLFASIKLRGEYRFKKRLALTAGVNFNHWSNSGIQFPNLGLNVPTVSLGARYSFYDPFDYQRVSKEKRKKMVPTKKNEYLALVSVGFRALSVTDNTIFPAYTLSLQYARLWSKKYKLSLGADVFYNMALQKSIENGGGNNTALQVGTNFTYHQTIGGVSILLGMGVYVFDETNFGETVYHRFGTRFTVAKRFVVNTALHTHWARADHMEFGIGYKLVR